MIFKSYRVTVNENMLLALFLGVVMLLINNLFANTLYSIAIVSTACYIFFFVTWFNQNRNRLNYYSIFLVFTFFFFFGQFFLLIIGIPMESGRTILDGLLPTCMLIKTGKLIINFMLIFHWGVLLSTQRINKYNQVDTIDSRYNAINNVKALQTVSMILFLLSIVPSSIILIENLRITLSFGYGAIFQSTHYTTGGFNNILRFASLFTIPSFLMMIIAFKDTDKLKYIFAILFLYLILCFSTGSRLNGILLLSILVIIKHYWYNEISRKDIIKYLIIAFILLILISVISGVRNQLYVSNDLGVLLHETLKKTLINNPLFTTMEEAGFTFLTTAAVVTYTPSVIPFRLGMSYLDSIFMIVPNLFWDIHPAAATNTDIVFKDFLTQYGGIGSSFIAEAFWNFGYGSLILAFIGGILVGNLTKQIAKYSISRNSKMFYLSIYIAEFSLLYVRSDTVSFWRNLIYFGVVPLLITRLISKNARSTVFEKKRAIRN